MDEVEFRILGPLEASVEGRPVPLGGPKQRALLALLLVRAGTVVAADELIDEVWGADAPPTVRAGLQVYLSRLRRTLGADGRNELLVRHAYGYALMIDPDRLDSERFEQLAREGREALAEGQAARAAETLSRALSIWRGPALADLARVQFAQAEARRLEDLRLQAIEHRITAELRLGRSSDVVSELEGLVAAHPYREGLRAQLMLALYRSGRQVEALEAYGAARRVLSDDLGLEPGYALRQLEQAILQHDQVLQLVPAATTGERAPTDAERPPDVPHVIRRESRTMRGKLALVAAAAAALIALLIGIAASQSEPAVMLPSRSLARVDPATLEVRAVISLNGAPSDLAVGRRAVFVALPGRRSVVAVDPSSRAATTLGAAIRPGRLAAGKDGLWVLDSLSRRVALLGSNRVYELGEAPAPGTAPLDAFASAGRDVWLAERDAEFVYRLDRRTGDSLAISNGGSDSFFNGGARRAMAIGAGSVWVSNPVSTAFSTDRLGRISRIDLDTGEVIARIRVPAPPLAIAADADSVWVALERGEDLWRIDPRDDIAAAAVRVGPVVDLALGEGAVWSLGGDGTLSRIDLATNTLSKQVVLARGISIAAGHGAVWIATP